MIEIRSKLAPTPGTGSPAPSGQLRLAFDLRQRSRFRASLATGEEVALLLPRGAVLRGGDRVIATDGRVFEIVAEIERLVDVRCASVGALMRAAYHLGNRHVPVEIGDGYLRLAPDHVLEEMLKGLHATVTPIDAPFEPEAGAYAGGHRHDEMGHGGRIHDHFGDPEARKHHDHGH